MYLTLQVLRKLFYPNKCIVCRKILSFESYEYICESCYQGLLKQHICRRCGRPYELGKTDCLACKNQNMSDIARVCGLFNYTDSYRKSVLRWKYSGVRKYAKGYAELMVYDLALPIQLQLDGLIPVPLAPSRAKKRGFNQALDLAKEISALSKIPVINCLKRSYDTKPQSACNKEERLKNIRGSIEINRKIFLPTLKNIAIVDDIYTTGSTVKECIKVLRKEYSMKDAIFYVFVVCIGG